MKPAPFGYADPATVDEALDVLAAEGEGAKVLAGGQSLIPLLSMRLAAPTTLVDINRVAGLDGIGFAAVTLNPGQGLVCYELSVSGIAPATAAHIHEAPFGEAGDVVVTLGAPTDGSSSGCVEVDRALVKDILQNPSEYYVNVHNAEYPLGALRGQLSK